MRRVARAGVGQDRPQHGLPVPHAGEGRSRERTAAISRTCGGDFQRDAKAAGLKVGVYWHAEESTTDEVKNSVNYLLDVLGNETLDFPIAYDWEDFGNFESYGMNLYDINECYNVFYNQLKLNGYDVCLYSSKRFLEGVWTNDVNSKIWLAHYTSATNYSGNYFMWQHASNGRIDGIATYVDFNVLYLDR